MNTSIEEMREQIAKHKAKKLYYFQWNHGGPYTVVVGDRYDEAWIIGSTDNPESLKEFGLPVYNHCPFN